MADKSATSAAKLDTLHVIALKPGATVAVEDTALVATVEEDTVEAEAPVATRRVTPAGVTDT